MFPVRGLHYLLLELMLHLHQNNHRQQSKMGPALTLTAVFGMNSDRLLVSFCFICFSQQLDNASHKAQRNKKVFLGKTLLFNREGYL